MMVNNSHTHSLNIAHFKMVQRISASMNLCEFSVPDRVWDNSMAINSKTTGVCSRPTSLQLQYTHQEQLHIFCGGFWEPPGNIKTNKNLLAQAGIPNMPVLHSLGHVGPIPEDVLEGGLHMNPCL